MTEEKQKETQRNEEENTEKTAEAVKKQTPEDKKSQEVENKQEEQTQTQEKTAEKQEEKAKTETTKKQAPKSKKTEATVNISNLPISTKQSAAVCKFISGKEIEKAISNLEDVLSHKKAVPMKGEIPHRKGKIMSGRYPKNTTEHFIKVLKSLSANASNNGLEEPIIITKAVANIGERPVGRFGSIKRKRSHVYLVAKSKSQIKSRKKKK